MTAYAQSPDVVFEVLDDDLVLVHLDTNRIYTLNATGARVWELLGDGESRTNVERALAAEFDVEDEQLLRELDALFEELLNEGLIRRLETH
jgi:hypothetical protein